MEPKNIRYLNGTGANAMKTKEIKLSVLVKQETKDFNVCFVLLKQGQKPIGAVDM